MVAILISDKLATVVLLRIKLFWNKGYGITILVYYIIKFSHMTQVIL